MIRIKESCEQPKTSHDRTYPWLGYHQELDMVVIWWEKYEGNVLVAGNFKYECGAYIDDTDSIDASSFVPYQGELVISNETDSSGRAI